MLNTKSFKEFAAVALLLKTQANPELFNFVLAKVLIEHPLTRHLSVPSAEETLPRRFFELNLQVKAQEEVAARIRQEISPEVIQTFYGIFMYLICAIQTFLTFRKLTIA